MTFKTGVDDRYLEDYVPGDVHEFGLIEVDQAEMIDFARRFDPQPFHADPTAAEQSTFGGLIASGWFTVSLAMRALVEHYISRGAGLGSPGVDELRWLMPVRPGDALSVRVTVVDAQHSRSKPGQGFVRSFTELLNQHGEVVMTMKGIGLVRCRGTDGCAADTKTMRETSPKSWKRTAVRCFAGYRSDERPLSFLTDDEEIKVRTILESWREPDYLYFKVETEEGGVYDIRHHEYEDSWEARGPLD